MKRRAGLHGGAPWEEHLVIYASKKFYVRLLHVNGCEMSYQLKSPRHKQIILKLDIGHPCYDQLTAVKISVR